MDTIIESNEKMEVLIRLVSKMDYPTVQRVKAFIEGLDAAKVVANAKAQNEDKSEWHMMDKILNSFEEDRNMSLKDAIEVANREALSRMTNAQIHWVDVKKAIDCPGMKENMIMHAGPPISWEEMGSTQRKGVIGAIQYEGWAKSPEEAERMVENGEVELSPCHEHSAVGSMAGITSPSMPVLVVQNETYGNYAYCHFYEGPAPRKLSYGCYDEQVYSNLKWAECVLAPVLKQLIDAMGSLDVKRIISKALFMGDDVHSRSMASTAMFILEISPHLAALDLPREDLVDILDFLRRSEQFFLHFTMAGSKATADAAEGIKYSTVLTKIARNGVEAGIQVSGLPGQWFTGPASNITGLFFSDYTQKDAQPDMGDSAITETTGLGCCAHAASPALGLTKGNVDMALYYTMEMQKICVGNNPNFAIPALNGRGSPMGIDMRKVLSSRIVPIINTAIAHKEGGQIGVGNAKVPMEAFKKALVAFNEEYAE